MILVERVDFDADPREPYHALWCGWLRFHCIPVPETVVLIGWLERDEGRCQVRYPTVTYDDDGEVALDETGTEIAELVAVQQLEAPPKPFPPLSPGARLSWKVSVP